MSDLDLEVYCKQAIERGATHSRQINPDSTVIAPWVLLKCQFGCSHYGKRYCCPPDTPTPEQAAKIIGCYNRAILFHLENPGTPSRRDRGVNFLEALIDLEIEMFEDGYYKAFVLLAGPCYMCKDCAKLKGLSCNFPRRARPSMEAFGIDVYQTARKNGYYIETLREKTETINNYCLMLVD